MAVVEPEARAIVAEPFRALIRGEITDLEYQDRIRPVWVLQPIMDEAVHEAIVWGEIVTIDLRPRRHAGDSALYPELREYLERLGEVLVSAREYENPDLAATLKDFRTRSMEQGLSTKPELNAGNTLEKVARITRALFARLFR